MEKAEERGEEQLSDIASQRAVLPIRDWEIPEHRKIMPIELQILFSAASTILRVERHAWEVVQPPPPGVKVNRNGDAAEGDIGKHYSARPYFDDLEKWLSKWQFHGFSPSNKTPKGQTSWEIYSQIDDDFWLLTIVTLFHHVGEHQIASVYRVNQSSLQNRLKQGYLRKRGK